MNANISGIEEIERKLKDLSWNKGKALLRKVANKVVSNSRKRITQQTDLEGRPFAPRSLNADEKLRKKKLITALRKWMRVVYSGDKQAIIGFSGKQLHIASEQQLGKTEKGSAAKNRTYAGSTKPATVKQAKELIRLGFKVKINGKTKKPTIKYITGKYTVAQAGSVIRKIRTWRGVQIKTEWDIILPPRSFLGITDSEYQEILQIMTDEINQAIS